MAEASHTTSGPSCTPDPDATPQPDAAGQRSRTHPQQQHGTITTRGRAPALRSPHTPADTRSTLPSWDTGDGTFQPEYWTHWRCTTPVYAMARKGTDALKTSRADAAEFPLTQPNPRYRPKDDDQGYLSEMSLLIVDRDHEQTVEAVDYIPGMPAPAYIALNRNTGTGQVCWALKYPVRYSQRASVKAQRYAALVTDSLVYALDGDTGFNGTMAKNPMHPIHDTRWGPAGAAVDLVDLATPLDGLGLLGRKRDTHTAAQPLSGAGRNVSLFNGLRHPSYDEVKHYTEWDAWHRHVRSHAWQLSETTVAEQWPDRGPLPWREAERVAESVAKYCWRHRDRLGRGRTHQQRRSNGGKARAAQQRKRTAGAITAAITEGNPT